MTRESDDLELNGFGREKLRHLKKHQPNLHRYLKSQGKVPGTGGTVSRQGERGGKADTGDAGRDTGDVDQPSRRRRSSR
jgi:hypothetical protein